MTTNPLTGVLVEELANSKRMLKGYRQALAALSKGKPPMGQGIEFKKAASKEARYRGLIAELREQTVFIRRALDQRKRRGTTLEQYLASEIKDPECRRHCEEADIGLCVALEIVRAREAAKMTKKELARALKTNQRTISRIESDARHVTIKMLGRIARALNCRLDIRIVPAAKRTLQGIKPQDILVLLKLCLWKEREWQHADLAVELGLSPAEVGFSMDRCRVSGFLDQDKKRVNRTALLEFLVHGLKYVYPVLPGSRCLGMPTSHSAPPLSKRIVSDKHDQYVWSYGEGEMRGQAIEPLYESVPFSAARDPQLHELLALVDALRVGRARERSVAADELDKRIGPKKR